MLGFQDSPGGVESTDRSIRKRTRTGCLQCRGRRRKCDGRHPQCHGCEIRGLACIWGLKASFHPSRSINLSQREAAILNGIEKGRLEPSRNWNHQFIDETEDIVEEYLTASHPPSKLAVAIEEDNFSLRSSHLSPPLLAGDLSIADIFTQYNQQVSDVSADAWRRDNLISSAVESEGLSQATESPAPRQVRGSLRFISPEISVHEAPRPLPQLPVTAREKMRLVSAYLRDTGTWCETTDSQMHFTVKSVHEMMESPPFVAAALSLASRQLDYLQRRQRAVTLELYQFTIQYLLSQNPAQADASILATCTLLCVYEMMASPVEEWRRHLRGCAGFLRNQRWNGSSGGIVKASFWAFARIDVWAAFNSGKATLIPTESWVDEVAIESVLAYGDLDDYCNLAILIFAKIVNILSDSQDLNGRARAASSNASLCALWDEMQKWHLLRPSEVCPLLRDADPSRAFPEVIYTRSSPNCGNTFYHAGCMLLLQDGSVVQNSSSQVLSTQGDVGDAVWHAREITGISISNQSHANWVNQLQPLYIAGKVFANPTNQTVPGYDMPLSPDGELAGVENFDSSQFYAEKIILLKHLAKIERETGWKTSDRAAELRSLWGFA